MSEEELRGAFSVAGSVLSVFIAKERDTKRPRGFGFVEMANNDEADNAISLFNGKEIGGRRVAVNLAQKA